MKIRLNQLFNASGHVSQCDAGRLEKFRLIQFLEPENDIIDGFWQQRSEGRAEILSQCREDIIAVAIGRLILLELPINHVPDNLHHMFV